MHRLFECGGRATESRPRTARRAISPATGTTLEGSRILVGAEIGHYWIINQKILDLSAYGKFVDNLTQNFSSTIVSLGPESITVQQGIGESRYGADAGTSGSLSLNDTVRASLREL